MDFTQVTDADHAAAIWNQLVRPGTDVYRVDDFGRVYHDKTRGKAWVMPSGIAGCCVRCSHWHAAHSIP